MITEVMARALKADELADRMLTHDDPAVRIFAEKVIKRFSELESYLIDAGVDYGY